MPRIEWLGVRLPSTDPIVAFDKLSHKLSRRQLDALDQVDEAVIGLVRIDGATSFGLGPKDGLSKSYMWCRANRYVETMTDSDARILSRLGEARHFRNLDDPRESRREATYPDPTYVASLMAVRHGKLVRPGSLPASVVGRLLRVAKSRHRMGEEERVIGRRIGRWGPKPT
jgi:hypothetical protein